MGSDTPGDGSGGIVPPVRGGTGGTLPRVGGAGCLGLIPPFGGNLGATGYCLGGAGLLAGMGGGG